MVSVNRPSTLTTGYAPTAEQFDALRARLAGELIMPGSLEFDQARKTANVMVDRRPAAIVRAANARDVASAVIFARTHALPLAVRSGGHSVAHHSMIDDAIVVDFSGMKGIAIDPETRIARVQPGATSGDLAGPVYAHGLALSTGDTASVGFGGLTTGGGIGFLVRKYGLAIDNLIAVQAVTAAGSIVTASASEHPDLFWAVRGGGGNFGIVTEFVFRLAPVGQQVLAGDLMLPASRAVLRGYLDYVADAPEGLTTIAHVMHAPPAPYVPQERVGELALSILVCWTGSIEEGEQALAPLRALATPIADVVNPMPYPLIYQFTAHQTAPHAVSIRSMFAQELSDDLIAATLTALEQSTWPFYAVQLRGLGGAMAGVGRDETAFAHRDARYMVTLLGLWMDPADDGSAHRAWVESLWQAIRHEGSGAYVNFLENEGSARLRDAYPEATYARLAEIKRQYDPHNVFRFNQNILPRA